MLHEHGLPERLDVKLSAVVEEVGLTTGAAYNIWPTQDDYQHDLARHVVETFSWSIEAVEGQFLDAAAAGGDLTDVIRSVALAYYELIVNEPDFYVSLHFWASRKVEPELADAIRRRYSRLQSGLVSFFVTALAKYGLGIGPQHSIEDIVVAVTSLTEGMAIRARFDEAPLRDGEVYAATLQALFERYAEPLPSDAGPAESFS
jgi:hypothetical protein